MFRIAELDVAVTTSVELGIVLAQCALGFRLGKCYARPTRAEGRGYRHLRLQSSGPCALPPPVRRFPEARNLYRLGMDLIPLTPERKTQLDDYAQRHVHEPAAAIAEIWTH